MKPTRLLVSILAFCATHVWGQALRFEQAAWPAVQIEHVDLAASVGFFEDTTSLLTPEAVLAQPFGPMPAINWLDRLNPYILARIWLKFSIDNTAGKDTLRFVFFPGMHARTALYEVKNDAVHLKAEGGLLKPQLLFSWQSNTNCLPLEVLPGTRSTYLVSVKNYLRTRLYDNVRTELFAPEAYSAYCRAYKEMQLPFLLFLGFVIGGLVMLVAFGLMQFLLTRGLAYLWYAFFALGNALNFVRLLEMYADVRWISAWIPWFQGFLALPLNTFFYLLFVRYFLDLHLQNGVISRLSKWAVWFFGSVCFATIISGFVHFSNGGTSNFVALSFTVFYIILGIPGYLVLYLAFKINSSLSRFVAVGTLMLIGASVVIVTLPVFLEVKPLHEQAPFENIFGGHAIFILLESLCFALGLGYKTKLLEIQKRLAVEEQLRDRQRIARDLHDEVGSTLSSISILSESARRNDQKGLDDARFDNIGDKARSALDSISDIVWSVNPENDSMEKALARMSAYASEILENVGTELRFQVGEGVEALTLPMEKRKDFYLIFKEAIHNCAKYARAKRVEVVLEKEDNALIMNIKDNGIGFETYPAGQETRNLGGNGLRNMAARAKAIGGDLKVTSSSGAGTEIRLMLPL